MTKTRILLAVLVYSFCGSMACGAVQPKPVVWTPELVAATQRDFALPGLWRFTVRSGAEFGKRCDMQFDADGTYRKSCRPPYEETGEGQRVGEWATHTMRIRLHDRVDLVKKRPIDDAEVTVVVETPANDAMTFNGELYERQ